MVAIKNDSILLPVDSSPIDGEKIKTDAIDSTQVPLEIDPVVTN